MTGLAEFLLARISEDEQWARDSAGPYYTDAEEGTPAYSGRILAECDARRRIVDQLLDAEHRGSHMSELAWSEVRRNLHYVCCLLALPYADHPGYREEWAP